jgi:hypothetical protein
MADLDNNGKAVNIDITKVVLNLSHVDQEPKDLADLILSAYKKVLCIELAMYIMSLENKVDHANHGLNTDALMDQGFTKYNVLITSG